MVKEIQLQSQLESDQRSLTFRSEEKPDTPVSKLSVKTIIVPPNLSNPLSVSTPLPLRFFQNERNPSSAYKTVNEFYKHGTSFISQVELHNSASVVLTKSPVITEPELDFMTDEDNVELEDRVDLDLSKIGKDELQFQLQMINLDPDLRYFENVEERSRFIDETADSSPADFYNKLKFRFIPTENELFIKPASSDLSTEPYLRYNARSRDTTSSRLPKLLPSTPSLSRRRRLPEHFKQVQLHQDNILEELQREIQQEEELQLTNRDKIRISIPHCIQTTEEMIEVISQ
jgi:hypothetical protein